MVRRPRSRQTGGRKLSIAVEETPRGKPRGAAGGEGSGQGLGGGGRQTRPAPISPPPPGTADTASHFIAKAKASVAHVHEIKSASEVPASIWAILTEMRLAPRLHVPENSPLNALAWERAPGLVLSVAPPNGDECAAAAADYGIAETGTLVFLSGPRSPSSWHFRPCCEFALVIRNTIVPRFEDIAAIITATQHMPATLNLVTG